MRSGRPVCDCVKEVLGMRTIYERRYVFIGSLNNRNVEIVTTELTQMERDSILASCIKRLGLREVSGRLGKQLFTLVGGNKFNDSMRSIGKENIESRLRTYIAEAVEDARPSC